MKILRKIFMLIPLFLVLILEAQEIKDRSPIKIWTIEQCVDYAIEHNIQIEISKTNQGDAAIDKSSAIAAFFPNISANTSHSWNNGLNQNITTGLLQNTTTQYTSLGARAGIIISNGLQNIRQLQRANLQILANQYQLDDMKDNVTILVVNAYLQIIYSKELLKATQAQFDDAQLDIKRTNAIIASGSLPKGDILELEANLSERQQAVQKADNDLRIARLNLSQLLQIDDIRTADYDDMDIPSSEVTLIPPDEVYDKAKTIRNDIKQAEINIEIAKKDVQIARGAYYPTINGSLNYNTRASYADRIIGQKPNINNPTRVIGAVQSNGDLVVTNNFSNIIGSYKNIFDQFEDNDGLSYGIGLSIPVFNSFSVRNRVKKNKIQIERQKFNLEKLKIDLRTNIYKAWTDMQAANNAYLTTQKSMKARQQAYDYINNRFLEGVVTVFELSQASNKLNAAKANHLQAKFDFVFKTKVLEYYFGIPINSF